jgi:hypothetical protein
MRGRGNRRDYGWLEVQAELADGIHPEVVAARLGEPIDYLLRVAEDRNWPITYVGVTPDQILDAHERADA